MSDPCNICGHVFPKTTSEEIAPGVTRQNQEARLLRSGLTYCMPCWNKREDEKAPETP